MLLEAIRSSCLIDVEKHSIVVLFKGELQHVVGLNQSAEALVRLGLTGTKSENLIPEYSRALDIPEEIACDFLSIIFEDWRQFGLFDSESQTATSTQNQKIYHPPQNAEPGFDSVVSIGGAAVRIALYDTGLAAITSPMVAGSDVPTDRKPDYTVCAWRDGGVWRISDSIGKRDTCTSMAVARDRILARLMANSWPDLSDAPCIHGATLRSPNGKHIMISGDSGRGKTTLALGLAKRSFTLLADDMSVFDAASGKVYPMKTNPSVKQGAWHPLAGMYPELAKQEPVNINGRLCKYVRRPPQSGHEQPHGIDALIFPNWQANAKPEMKLYDSYEALLSMLRWSYLPQNQESLQAMADFLANIPLYELTYSEFSEADSAIADLLRCQK